MKDILNDFFLIDRNLFLLRLESLEKIHSKNVSFTFRLNWMNDIFIDHKEKILTIIIQPNSISWALNVCEEFKVQHIF